MSNFFTTGPEIQGWEEPPTLVLTSNSLIRSFVGMTEDAKKHDGVFSYEQTFGPHKRRFTILTDAPLADIVFDSAEKGYDALQIDMAKIGHAWFGIPKSIVKHNRSSLDQVKNALGVQNVQRLNNQIGKKLKDFVVELPNDGEMDMWYFVISTFFPVNEAMWGSETMSRVLTPEALQWWHEYNDGLADVASGLNSFKNQLGRQEAANKLAEVFRRSIERGNHTKSQCPVLKARIHGVPNWETFSADEHSRMCLSLFWAAQGNTLPLSFWLLAHILADSQLKERAVKEARDSRFEVTEGEFEPLDELPFIMSCLYEVLRLYTAALTHRSAVKDFGVITSSGKKYRIPKGDLVTVSAYVLHRNPEVFPEPKKFCPERWLDSKLSPQEVMHAKMAANVFVPFSKGPYSCSGKHLAQREIPTLVALLLREFDMEMMDSMPEPATEEILGSVEPKSYPFDPKIHTRVRFRRVNLKAAL